MHCIPRGYLGTISALEQKKTRVINADVGEVLPVGLRTRTDTPSDTHWSVGSTFVLEVAALIEKTCAY